jgi:integrase
VANKPKRKSGINKNHFGSVRNINGLGILDFPYLGKRVRESSQLSWNKKNAKFLRTKLDKIGLAIEFGEFRYGKVFPKSKKKKIQRFSELEIKYLNLNKSPDFVFFKDYAWEWYDLYQSLDEIGRSSYSYESIIRLYLIPFFGELTFLQVNSIKLSQFVVWAREQKLRNKPVQNESIRKYLTLLKSICKKAAIKYHWGGKYEPFFDFEMPKVEKRRHKKIFPFSVDEQDKIIEKLPDFWKPFFKFAFSSGISQGEQIGLKYSDFDWNKKIINIHRAITMNKNGEIIEGPCKTEYRRRSFVLSGKMYNALIEQRNLYERFNSKYFFCDEKGKMFDASSILNRVWKPALKLAGVKYRNMQQTRHSFATYQISMGKNPLTVSKVLGHANAEMVLTVYAKYLEDVVDIGD